MPTRTLRAANALLYASSTLLIIAAVVYCTMYKNMPVWQLWSAVALCIAGTVWGLYYVTLCYRVTAEGISRHVYLRCTQRLLWGEVERAELEESEAQGIAGCHIILRPHSGAPLRISSDLLHLDDVQELADDLRTIGLLPAADKTGETTDSPAQSPS